MRSNERMWGIMSCEEERSSIGDRTARKVVVFIFVCRGQSPKSKVTWAQETRVHWHFCVTVTCFWYFRCFLLHGLFHFAPRSPKTFRFASSGDLFRNARSSFCHQLFLKNRTKRLIHEVYSLLPIIWRLKQMSTLKHTTDVVVFTSQSSLSLLILSCRVK